MAIPTHDRRETVVLAALSAVRQEREPLEVLVLCDGCTDGTSEAIAALGDPRIRAIDLPKGDGYAYAHRNVALEQGRGDVVTWLADDDLYLPGHLARVGALWDAGDVDLVTSAALMVHEDDRLTWIGRDLRVPEHRRVMVDEHNTSVMAAVSVRRSLAAEVGGWDGLTERAGDWRLWKRVLAAGARPTMSAEATVLHFRATGRDQAWPSRVAQNQRWFDDTAHAQRRAELGDAALLARAEFEAVLSAERRAALDALAAADGLAKKVDAVRTDVTAERDAARAAHAHEAGEAVRLTRELLALGDEAQRLRELAVEREQEADAARAEGQLHRLEAERLQRELDAVLLSRWWRLRGTVGRLGRARR